MPGQPPHGVFGKGAPAKWWHQAILPHFCVAPAPAKWSVAQRSVRVPGCAGDAPDAPLSRAPCHSHRARASRNTPHASCPHAFFPTPCNRCNRPGYSGNGVITGQTARNRVTHGRGGVQEKPPPQPAPATPCLAAASRRRPSAAQCHSRRSWYRAYPSSCAAATIAAGASTCQGQRSAQEPHCAHSDAFAASCA